MIALIYTNPWSILGPMIGTCVVVTGWIIVHLRNHPTIKQTDEAKKDTNLRLASLSEGIVYNKNCEEIVKRLDENNQNSATQCRDRHQEVKDELKNCNKKLDQQLKMLIELKSR